MVIDQDVPNGSRTEAALWYIKKIFDNLQEAERTIHDDNCFTKRVQAVPKLGHVKTSSFELI